MSPLSLLKAQLTPLLYGEGERLGKGKLGAWLASPQFSSRFLPAIPSIAFIIAKSVSHKWSKSGKSKTSGSLNTCCHVKYQSLRQQRAVLPLPQMFSFWFTSYFVSMPVLCGAPFSDDFVYIHHWSCVCYPAKHVCFVFTSGSFCQETTRIY